MDTLESLLKKGTNTLLNAGIEEARLDAWLLLEYLTGKNRAYYFAHREEAVADTAAREYEKLISARSCHTPVQHLTHQAFFMGYEFYVDERVLIPRQDTEILVETALELLESKKAPAVLDMCTGSGCILLSILALRPDASGVGADIMEGALEVAGKNAERLFLDGRASWVKSDLFSADFFQKKNTAQPLKYDMLISNPPYIPAGEICGLMEEVRFHDPGEALDGGQDGLDFYREITAQAGRYLKEDGWLLFEIGCSQGEAVSGLLKKHGFCEVEVKQDLAGLDRVVLGKKQEEHHV